MLKIVVAAMAAACLVGPAAASAEEGGGAVDHLTCADGTVLTPPFSPPVCREHGGVASVTCADGSTLTPPFDGERCPAQAEGGDDPGEEPADPGADDGDGSDAPPRFDAGFLNRVWRIAGSADGFEDGALDFTAARFMKLPRRFADQDDELVGEDSRVLVTRRTRVVDAAHHRLTGDAAASALDAADRVVVVAKLVPEARWLEDEDGEPVPTLRAKRIEISRSTS